MLKAIFRWLPVAALAILGGCDQLCWGTQCATAAPVDAPGSFTTYSVVSFANEPAFCNLSTSLDCIFQITNDFSVPMAQNGWTNNGNITDGYINGQWTPATTAANITSAHSNLLYLSTHGGIVNGYAQLCLRYCNSSTDGGTYSVQPNDFGPAWSGANWLVIDACTSVLANVGWESVFGGSLHGVLGFNEDNHGLEHYGDTTFARYIASYDNAIDAWEQAVAASGNKPAIAMLVPSANRLDSIEAPGGPHFGYNNQTNPTYYYCCDGQGNVTTQSVAKLGYAPAQQSALIPEAMDENYWYNYYGGSSVPSTRINPTANDHLYRNAYVTVEHFQASGGLMVSAQATGTAKGFSMADALAYAQSWVGQNGGMPADAALTFAGAEGMRPTSLQATSDQPYPNVRQYIFIWRHASSALLGADRIYVGVDDAGHLTKYYRDVTTWNSRCECEIDREIPYYAAPWVPVYHIHTYVRAWRSLGGSTGTRFPMSQTTLLPGTTTAGYAYCASDISDPNSVAQPCQIGSSSSTASYYDLSTGLRIMTSEAL